MDFEFLDIHMSEKKEHFFPSLLWFQMAKHIYIEHLTFILDIFILFGPNCANCFEGSPRWMNTHIDTFTFFLLKLVSGHITFLKSFDFLFTMGDKGVAPM
jgi:hypothetical protein